LARHPRYYSGFIFSGADMLAEMKLPKGIEAYRAEVEAILAWLADGTKDQNEFDAWASRRCREVMRGKLPHPQITGDSYILGGLMAMDGDRDWMLDLLQHMMSAKLVKAEQRGDLIVYSKAQ
jgi:hypothetical protein